MAFQIQLLCVGRLKGNFKYLQTGIDEYIKRLSPYAKVSVVEVADETIAPSITDEQVKDIEGDRLLAHMERSQARGGLVVALSERGEAMDSESFSRRLMQRLDGGDRGTNPPNGGIPLTSAGPMIVVVGGPLGLSQRVIDRANWVVSLSPMTFPHTMVRLILLEQLYRAFRIARNESYHK